MDFGRPIGIEGRTGQPVIKGQVHYGGNGQGTSSEANQLGQTWGGDGATKTNDGLGLISADGTRVYRSSTHKD